MTRPSLPAADKRLQQVYGMSFGLVYPMYVAKAEKKNRTKREVDKLIDELAKGKSMEKILRTAEG